MSQPCAIVSCPRSSRALCHCCHHNLCLTHLNEHNDFLNNGLVPLADRIDTLGTRLHQLNMQETIRNGRQKFEQWRLESHQKIDQFFEQKCEELDRLVAEKLDEQQEEIQRLQTHTSELMRTQAATREDIHQLEANVDQLQEQMADVQETFLQIQTHPLVIDNQLISIRGINEPGYNLSALSSVYKNISVPKGSFGVLASNDHFLLIHQAPNLCLIDRDLTIRKQVVWRHGMILDFCWSSTLNRFIIINEKDLFLLEETTMSVSTVRTLERKKWFSCACSDRFLFLSANKWGSTITKISLKLPNSFTQQWESPMICQRDEYIDSIAYQRNTLAMIIRNKTTETIRLELSSADNLQRISSLQLQILWNPSQPFHCCPFVHGDWLVADYESGSLLHLGKQGKVVSSVPYNTVPQCVTTLFNSTMLAVSTKDGINFHNLNYAKTYTIFVVWF